MSKKDFKSATGEDVRIALTNGHATIVGSEWKALDERFHSAAYAAGCVSKDMMRNHMAERIPPRQIEQAEKVASLEDKVYKAIEELVEGNQLDAFNKSGKPDAQILTNMVDERVHSHVRDKVWYKYQTDTGTIEE